MLTNLPTINFQYNRKKIHQPQVTKSHLASLSHDIVSFGAMKKNEFEGIDLAVVEKFKAPIEKFNTNEDLQKWAGDKAKSIAVKDFDGHHKKTKIQRKAMLKEWSDYVFNENDNYTNTTAFLILNSITKDLKPNNDNIPPLLDKSILSDCIYEIDKNTKNNPKYQFDLNKMYKNKLRTFYTMDKETYTDKLPTKWVIIPSKQHDPENFEANVEKLKALSYKTWCTKSYDAKPYLTEGDFHIYLENGKTKLGIRFFGNVIDEIQDAENNGDISIYDFEVIQKHINENNLTLTDNAENDIKYAKIAQLKIKKTKSDLKDAIEKNDVKTILNYLNIYAEEHEDGNLAISCYRQPSKLYTFKDLGIDENKLFEKIQIIEGDAYFPNSKVTNLGTLKYVGGNADFSHSKVTDLGKLEFIGENAYFQNSKVTNLGMLESIGGNANFSHSKISDLGNLKVIGGNTYFSESQITDLGNLEAIWGNADFSHSQVTKLGNLKTIGNSVYIKNSQLTVEDFKNIQIISKEII